MKNKNNLEFELTMTLESIAVRAASWRRGQGSPFPTGYNPIVGGDIIKSANDGNGQYLLLVNFPKIDRQVEFVAGSRLKYWSILEK